MKIELNHIVLTITGQHESDGTYITVTTDYGEWCHRVSDRQLPIETDKDLANALDIVLSRLEEAEDFPTYRHWCDYIEHGGEEVEEGSFEHWQHWQDEWQTWNDVSRHMAGETRKYLKKIYDL